jgi:DMSO/TMAO reductase YedYZ molybdopterin-dependent catalytic subunit
MNLRLDKITQFFKNSDMSRRQLTALIFSSTVALLFGGLRRIAHGYQRLTYYPIRSIEGTQSFGPTTWRLKVDGLVENAEAFTYEEILQLPKMTQIKNFVCVEGWGLNRQKWEGIHLRQIFEKVRVSPAARFVTFHAIGGKYTDSLTLDEALEPETMLAYRLNDEPLDPQQGKPIRLIVPRMYGYKGVKWVERITLEENQHVGYWERNGYPVDGSIRQ